MNRRGAARGRPRPLCASVVLRRRIRLKPIGRPKRTGCPRAGSWGGRLSVAVRRQRATRLLARSGAWAWLLPTFEKQPMKAKKNWLEGADAALKRAALRARELAERTGTPLYGCKNGHVVNLLAGKKPKASH